MGYIYLKPDVITSRTTYKHNTLPDYIVSEKINIPYSRNNQLSEHFDQIENVLQSSNHIYRLTDDEDAFVIANLEHPVNLITYDNKPQPPTAYFKALLTARNDIYPVEYLKDPDFVLVEHNNNNDNDWMARSIDIDDSPEMKEMAEKIRLKLEK